MPPSGFEPGARSNVVAPRLGVGSERREQLAAGGFLHRAAGQVATFSSKVEVVRVDALVTENGRIVRGLAPGDFEVRDNGVVQQVDFASFEEMPLDVAPALDASDSVSGERLAHLRHAGHTLLGALQADDRAALLTFSHVIALRQELTPDAERVGRALDALRRRHRARGRRPRR